MADSSITKKALASALKKLMSERPFSQITVINICELCEMNRKSFYYHFKDKYDLVSYICYTEFIKAASEKDYTDGFDLLYDMCNYFEKNKSFYRKILKNESNNPFYDYFKGWLMPIAEDFMKKIFASSENNQFYADFFTDAFINSLKKWILSPNPMPAKKFIEMIRSCVYGISKNTVNQIDE
ncbi:MAG: TetR/AcrR family transcriptional regulator C-terminal domain-containing protein [Clostridia bacterium]|nr:TetR/AcrR family transcriptional regulator C-terminal domain-containing protein [Clostridia bacterium]